MLKVGQPNINISADCNTHNGVKIASFSGSYADENNVGTSYNTMTLNIRIDNPAVYLDNIESFNEDFIAFKDTILIRAGIQPSNNNE